MPRPAGLILDYGNVLSHAQDQRWMGEAALRLGGDAGAFRAAYWEHRHAYDADLPAAAYWQRVAATTRPGALAPGEFVAPELTATVPTVPLPDFEDAVRAALPCPVLTAPGAAVTRLKALVG